MRANKAAAISVMEIGAQGGFRGWMRLIGLLRDLVMKICRFGVVSRCSLGNGVKMWSLVLIEKVEWGN